MTQGFFYLATTPSLDLQRALYNIFAAPQCFVKGSHESIASRIRTETQSHKQ